MLKRFVAVQEAQPGSDWLDRFVAGRKEAERWYQGNRLADPPTAVECRAALRHHMPELLPQYDRVCTLVGDDELAHCMLSHYRPPPVISGCSQAVWLGKDGPALVRNYDFPLDVVSGRFEASSWSGRKVIATSQRPWGGCLDGMNEDGLVASLTYGGSRALGLGFSIILMLRYVLETCWRVDQAVAALSRIPIALSQNVTLLDGTGAYATLFLGPDRSPATTRLRACTNHQEIVLSSSSGERQAMLMRALDDTDMNLPALAGLFLAPPLYSRQIGFTTVYTAVYRPTKKRVDYLWPGKTWRQSFDRFEAADYTHDYGRLVS
ncbi:C45 family autoproteolytic acyltransferase/hydolase [Rhodopila sp.]|uniref:C45 family autoproteolytic acyltransferase/hydolase n=1 Tax=Rhodopila sp. TaxID=2480087 RepID=UPI003D136A0E